MQISNIQVTTASASTNKNESSSESNDSVEINTFEDELDKKVDKNRKKLIDEIFSYISYDDTKSLSDSDIDNKFSNLEEVYRTKIKYMRDIANRFSEDENANKAIFEEAKKLDTPQERIMFSVELLTSKIRNSLITGDEIQTGEEPAIFSLDGTEIDLFRSGKYSSQKIKEEDIEEFFNNMIEDSEKRVKYANRYDDERALKAKLNMYLRVWEKINKGIEDSEKNENEEVLKQYTKNTKPNPLNMA